MTKWYGSLVNRLAENYKTREAPKVGMGATEYCYSDRHAFTVIKIISPKKIVVTKDIATRIDTKGISESQEYEFLRDFDAVPIVLRLNKHSQWKEAGHSRGDTFVVGVREEYYDYGF